MQSFLLAMTFLVNPLRVRPLPTIPSDVLHVSGCDENLKRMIVLAFGEGKCRAANVAGVGCGHGGIALPSLTPRLSQDASVVSDETRPKLGPSDHVVYSQHHLGQVYMAAKTRIDLSEPMSPFDGDWSQPRGYRPILSVSAVPLPGGTSVLP